MVYYMLFIVNKGQIHIAAAQRNVNRLRYTAASFQSKCPIHKALTWKFAAVYRKQVRRKEVQFKWGGYHLNWARSRAGRTAHAPVANFPTCFVRNYDAPTFCESRRDQMTYAGKKKKFKNNSKATRERRAYFNPPGGIPESDSG